MFNIVIVNKFTEKFVSRILYTVLLLSRPRYAMRFISFCDTNLTCLFVHKYKNYTSFDEIARNKVQ